MDGCVIIAVERMVLEMVGWVVRLTGLVVLPPWVVLYVIAALLVVSILVLLVEACRVLVWGLRLLGSMIGRVY